MSQNEKVEARNRLRSGAGSKLRFRRPMYRMLAVMYRMFVDETIDLQIPDLLSMTPRSFVSDILGRQ